MGSALVKKNRIRIKNILDELMPKISGKIVIKKTLILTLFALTLTLGDIIQHAFVYGRKITGPDLQLHLSYLRAFLALTVVWILSNVLVENIDSNNSLQMYWIKNKRVWFRFLFRDQILCWNKRCFCGAVCKASIVQAEVWK